MNAFTIFHVVLSLIGIVAGFRVVAGFVASKPSASWTLVFLIATTATVLTGFLFPFNGFTPAIGLGLISLPVLGLAWYALFGRKLAGGWRATYVVTATLSFYFNFFVLIVQSFQKIPALKALAPTQQEPPFAVAQGAALLAFIVAGIFAVRRFRPTEISAG